MGSRRTALSVITMLHPLLLLTGVSGSREGAAFRCHVSQNPHSALLLTVCRISGTKRQHGHEAPTVLDVSAVLAQNQAHPIQSSSVVVGHSRIVAGLVCSFAASLAASDIPAVARE